MTKKTITFADGKEVCALGMGTWNLGVNPAKRKEEAEALLTGIDLGMTMVDTAEMYENECFIGEVIATRRERVFLVSKVHPAHADFRGTVAACEASLKRLRTDHIDLYLLHWKSHHPIAKTVEALCELQRSGKIGLWGVSNLDVDDMEQIVAMPGGCACDANQVLYNLRERGVEYDLIPWAKRQEMPVIAYSPLGEGGLMKHVALQRVAEKHGATASQIALAWTIRGAGVMAIPKAGAVAHVTENFQSLSITLDADDLETLDKAFTPPMHKVPLKGW